MTCWSCTHVRREGTYCSVLKVEREKRCVLFEREPGADEMVKRERDDAVS